MLARKRSGGFAQSPSRDVGEQPKRAGLRVGRGADGSPGSSCCPRPGARARVRDPGVRPERARQERGHTRADRRAGRQRPPGAPHGGTRARRPGGGGRSAARGDDACRDRGARRRRRGGRPGGRCGRPGHSGPDASRRGRYGGRGGPEPGGRDRSATHAALAQPRQGVDRRGGGAPIRRGCRGFRTIRRARRCSRSRGGCARIRRSWSSWRATPTVPERRRTISVSASSGPRRSVASWRNWASRRIVSGRSVWVLPGRLPTTGLPKVDARTVESF